MHNSQVVQFANAVRSKATGRVACDSAGVAMACWAMRQNRLPTDLVVRRLKRNTYFPGSVADIFSQNGPGRRQASNASAWSYANI